MRQLDEESCLYARLKYYDFFMVMSAIAAVCGNFLALKVTQIGPVTFGASVVFFPVSYVLGDLITEVYGFYRARRVMWVGLAAMFFAAIMSSIVLALPAAPGEYSTQIDNHYTAVFSVIPRIFAASILAFVVGTYMNDVVMSKQKIRTEGRGFWKRAILSTALGQAADSLVFYPLAFAGVWPWHQIWAVMATHFCVKVGLEILGVPFTSVIVSFVKRAEGLDHFDRGIDYNPFGLSVQQSPAIDKRVSPTHSSSTPETFITSSTDREVTQ